jgi:hypothetical protein
MNPSSQPAWPQDAAPVRLSRDLIKTVLRGLGVRFLLDEDGDPVAVANGFLLRFLARGPHHNIYVQTVLCTRTFGLEDRPGLLEVVNEWNRSHRWPTATVVTDDHGVVRVGAEAHLLCGVGISREQLAHTVECWIAAAWQFADWLRIRV